jgi:hypothetical protein
MNTRYSAGAMTGLNNTSKTLKSADKHPAFWDAFADAKAAVISRAEILREHLDSSSCDYQMHSESGDHRYAVSFEYGPRSLDPALPFKTVFHVDPCTVKDG